MTEPMRSEHRDAASPADGDGLKLERRAAFRLAGGGAALAALAAAGLRGGALAQATPSPAASPSPSMQGAYAVLRTRTVKADKSIDDLNCLTQTGLIPIVRAIPGFIEYVVVQNTETRARTGVSVYADKTGADASTQQVNAYLQAHGLADYDENVDPVVQEGVIVTSV